ncbi:hypothetical protein VTI74DRAFT_8761 [Chaetomium olivicolor]
MSSLDLDQVLYARAGWRKAILVPLWIFQILVLLCLMGIFAYRLAETFEHYENEIKEGRVPIVEVVWEATNVGFNLIALVLNILEIARKATERLTPFLMVCTHVIKLTLSFAVLALDIVAYLQRMDGYYSTIGLSLDCGLLAATLASFIYSITVYRRLLKYEDYHLTANAKAQGFVPGDSVELGYNTSYPRGDSTIKRYSDYSSYSYPSQTEPAPQQQGTVTYIRPYQPSATPSSTAVTTPGSTTTATTDDLKAQVDRAIGAEFGWNTPNSSSATAHSTGGATATTQRSGSVVVASGTVQAGHATMQAPPQELLRQKSWVTERGVITEEPDEGHDGDGEDHGRVMGRVGGDGKGGDGEGLLLGGK